MDINKFKKIEKIIKENSFDIEYKNINIVMFCLSMFGHISSIFLAYFFLSKIFENTITNNYVLIFLSSIIILSGVELLKRDIFQKFSTQLIKNKTLNKNVYPLFLLSILIISISFFATISGAKEFSSKSNEIEETMNVSYKKYEDSLNNISNIRISEINNDTKSIKDKIDAKDNEQTELEKEVDGTKQRNRIKDLKSEKSELKSDISKNDSLISQIKSETYTKIKEYETKNFSDFSKKKEENSKNSLIFVLISTLIEVTILAGVYFNKYYIFRSYNEYKTKIEKDPNFQKWNLYNSIVDIIYTDEIKINDKLPSLKSILDLSKINGVNLLQKDLIDFIKVLVSLGVLKSSGPVKYIVKDKDSVKDLLKNHFNII